MVRECSNLAPLRLSLRFGVCEAPKSYVCVYVRTAQLLCYGVNGSLGIAAHNMLWVLWVLWGRPHNSHNSHNIVMGCAMREPSPVHGVMAPRGHAEQLAAGIFASRAASNFRFARGVDRQIFSLSPSS